jgi:endonuclease-3
MRFLMNSRKAVKQLKEIERLVVEFGEEPRLAAEGWGEDWQVLIAIMLSAQTRDTKTVVVCEKLFGKYSEVGDLARAPLREVEKMIGSINFYKTKARNIKETARMISLEGIGESVEDLIRLPGVGRKTANVYLVEVKKAAAIGVDTHVGRISRKMGWTRSKNPVVVERDLMVLFPKRYWNSINWILVRFGQSVGRSRKRENLVLAKLIK